MKSISVQYQELKEGKMNKHQFLRNARMMFPNFVTNHNSFDDSVKILKNKGLLNEGDAVKGTPDKAPSYDYPTQPGKYMKVVQEPEVDEQDGIYPATTLTDIPKEEVSKPIKSKNRPDGLEPAKDKDKKNEMKKIRIVKESKKSLTENSVTAKQIQDKYNEMFGRNPQTTFADGAKALGISESEIAIALFSPNLSKNLREDDDAAFNAMIEKAMEEEEAEKAIKSGFGIQDPLEEAEKELATPDVEAIKKLLMQNNMLVNRFKTVGSPVELEDLTDEILGLVDPKILQNISGARTAVMNALRRASEEAKGKSKFSPGSISSSYEKALQGKFRSPGASGPGESSNRLKETIKKMVNRVLDEYEKGDESDEAPSNREAVSEIVEMMIDRLEDMKSFKKSELEDVFNDFEDKVGKRYSDDVFNNVIDQLKEKGYNIK